MALNMHERIIHQQHLHLVDEFIFTEFSASTVEEWLGYLADYLPTQLVPGVSRWMMTIQDDDTIHQTTMPDWPFTNAILPKPATKELKIACVTDSAIVFESILAILKRTFDSPLHARWFNALPDDAHWKDAFHWVLED